MFEEIKNINTSTKSLRSFGITFGIIFLLITGFLLFKSNESYLIFSYIASFFLILGLLIPIILKPIYIIWMVFAVILGSVMTRIILILLFYFVLTPIGIITKIAGKDFLNLKNADQDSYWNFRDSKYESNQDYEKQF